MRRVGLSNFRAERAKDRKMKERRACEAEMPPTAAEEEGRVVRKD